MTSDKHNVPAVEQVLENASYGPFSSCSACLWKLTPEMVQIVRLLSRKRGESFCMFAFISLRSRCFRNPKSDGYIKGSIYPFTPKLDYRNSPGHEISISFTY